MPKSPAQPVNAQTLAAFRYGVGILADAHPDEGTHIWLGLKERDMAAVMAGVQPLKQGTAPLRNLAEKLIELSKTASAPASEEALRTAQALVSPRVLTCIHEGIEWRLTHPPTAATLAACAKPKESRGVYNAGFTYYAINAKGERIAEIVLEDGWISPREAINLLYDVLEKYEGMGTTNKSDDDDDDDEGEVWKQGAKP